MIDPPWEGGADWQYTGRPKRARFSDDISISSISTTKGTATVTTKTAHGLKVGDKITITGSSPAAYNGSFEVASAKSTELTFKMDSSPTGHLQVPLKLQNQ